MLMNPQRLKSIGYRWLKKSDSFRMGPVYIEKSGNKYFHRGTEIRTFENLQVALYNHGVEDGKKKRSKELQNLLTLESNTNHDLG